MELFSCLHPVTCRNPHTGEFLSVPCGKCDVCRSRRAIRWSDRLRIERECHPFAVFFTLTYSDEFVPRFDVDSVNRRLIDVKTGEFHTFSSLGLDSDKESLDYVLSRRYLTYYTPVFVQNFIKRLRSKINYYEHSIYEKRVRYFINTEYGPTTHRVHHHGILFFESRWFAHHAKEVIASSWSSDGRTGIPVSYGRVDVQTIGTDSAAANYVASYVNGVSRLPKIYSRSPFVPKSLFSRCPPIGSLLYKSKDLQEIFNSGAVRTRKPNLHTLSYDIVPLPQSFKDRLYPKIRGFSQIPVDVLYRLYGFFGEKAWFCQSFGEFKELIINIVTPYDNLSPRSPYVWVNSDMRLYFNNLLTKESSLRRYYSILVRFENFRYQFGLSVKQYVDKIIDFYVREDYANLLDYFNFQSEYTRLSDSRYLINLDSWFTKDNSFSVKQKLILMSYGFDEYSFTHKDEFVGEKCPDYVRICSASKKRVDNSHKTRCKNDYLENRSNVYLNKIYA